MIMDAQIVALYELKRQGFLLGYLQNPDRFSNSLAFAYYNRIEPIFHENIERETYDEDPFSDVYAVKGVFMRKVFSFIEENQRAGKLDKIGFYDLENEFGSRENRVEIIHTLEYARIDGRFNDDVWGAVVKNAPIEANDLDDSFGPNDVEFR
jgi:hypothetical protein